MAVVLVVVVVLAAAGGGVDQVQQFAVFSAKCNSQVLYFLAYSNETMFEGGKWKQPISPYWCLGSDRGFQ